MIFVVHCCYNGHGECRCVCGL